MIVNGFKLIRKSDDAEAGSWVTIPARIEALGLRVDGAAAGFENADYRLAATTWEVPDPVQPTSDQIYDEAMATQHVLNAVVTALNDGSLPVGQNRPAAQVKAIIKTKMR